MTPPMAIRPLADADDLDAAIALTTAAWRVAYDGIVSPAGLETIARRQAESDANERFETVVGRARSVALVAEVDDAIVGTAYALWDPGQTRDYVDDDEAELRSLYVHPDRWGDGIGTALLEGIIDEVPADRAALVLETFAANDAGRAFYEARGFALAGETTYALADETYPSVLYRRRLD